MKRALGVLLPYALAAAIVAVGAGVAVHHALERHLPTLYSGPSPSPPMGFCPIRNEMGSIDATIWVIGPRPLPACASIGVPHEPMIGLAGVHMWARACSYPEAVRDTGPYQIQVLTAGRLNADSRRACAALQRTAYLAPPT